jgi:hypothetical protein
LDRALAELRPGDTLVVWKLHRLGRSLRHLLEMSAAARAANSSPYRFKSRAGNELASFGCNES